MPLKSGKAPLLESVSQSPLLLAADSEKLFQASIEFITAHEHAPEILGQATHMSDDHDFWGVDDWRAALRPYVVKNGVLQIPVMGVLLNRFSYQLGRWATGYTYIEKAMQRGLRDSEVKGIAFIHDSPGGEVAGCFELVDKIFEARGEKPMRAFAADHAYSASFALASAADEIVITRSGGVGSVGVVTAHVEFSKMLEEMGIKITFIFRGAHKVDGNPYEKLPENVKSRIEERIDKIYGVFTSTVARNRAMEEDDVRATEALTYDANDSIEIGFADRLGALEEELVIFSQEAVSAEDEQMAKENENAEATPKGVDQATHDAAVASARTEGATAERTRITTILNSEEAKARPAAAMSTAMNTGMSVEEAATFLKTLPEETSATKTEETKPNASGTTPFDAAMSQDNPEVGGGDAGGDKAQDDDPDAESKSILASFAGMSGRAQKKAS